MRFVVAAVFAALSAQAFHATSQPLTATAEHELIASHHWYSKCPVPFSGLRLVTLNYRGFDGRVHTGQLVVNASVVPAVETVFGKLYAMHFPIHHMKLSDAYGPVSQWPRDLDVTYSFSCRQAVASPCNGMKQTGTGSWSMHAYGEAIDINPIENPYVGCGQTREKVSVSYMKRTPLRKGMVTPAVYALFRSVGWGWGGAWYGPTKDYMHFSANGH
ncbi:MAG TPA: M15 family metallopeptidase [Gaiellaceae bacterium]